MNRVLVLSLTVVVLLVAAFAATWFFQRPGLASLAEQVLVDLQEGRAADVLARASAAFRRETTRERLEEEARNLERAVGRLRAVRATKDGESPAGRVTLELECERGTTSGTFHFVEEDGTWRLRTFSVEVPAAPAPAVPPGGR
jgi:hypothetical protein